MITNKFYNTVLYFTPTWLILRVIGERDTQGYKSLLLQYIKYRKYLFTFKMFFMLRH